jgi:hypothetical protein
MKKIICPKCGHEQANTDECVKCGVIISKFNTIKDRSKSVQRDNLIKPAKIKTKNVVFRIIKWSVGIFIFLFIGFAAAFMYIGNKLTDMGVIYGSTLWYCNSSSSRFTAMCEDADTCCHDCFSELLKSSDYTRSELADFFQDIIPPDEIRDLGFLVAKSIKIPDDSKIPILVCKTAIEPIRPEDGGPPGKDHLVVYHGSAASWMTPLDYEALDKSQYIDIEVLIKEYEEIMARTQ